jgi:hypothetical protein
VQADDDDIDILHDRIPLCLPAARRSSIATSSIRQS